jgi:hypothetical protein
MCMIRQCFCTCNQLIQIRTDKLLHKAYLYSGTFHTVKSAELLLLIYYHLRPYFCDCVRLARIGYLYLRLTTISKTNAVLHYGLRLMKTNEVLPSGV